MNFSEVKSVLETVAELVKKSATLDLQEKIVALREFVISPKEENISLREDNQALRLELATGLDFALKDGVYWKEGDLVPFCQRCLDGSKKTVHLQAWGSEGRKCFECESYYEAFEQAGVVKVYSEFN